jgi:hypothetical protein
VAEALPRAEALPVAEAALPVRAPPGAPADPRRSSQVSYDSSVRMTAAHEGPCPIGSHT